MAIENIALKINTNNKTLKTSQLQNKLFTPNRLKLNYKRQIKNKNNTLRMSIFVRSKQIFVYKLKQNYNLYRS